jgi:chitodextrinase
MGHSKDTRSSRAAAATRRAVALSAVAAALATAPGVAQAADRAAPADIPTAPAGAAATAGAPRLSWAAVLDAGGSGVKQYNVRRNGVFVASVTGTSFTDRAALAEGAYTYTVRAEDRAGNKARMFSPGLTVVVDRTAPAAPAGLAAAGAMAATLTWSPSADAGSGIARYRVLRDGVEVATVAAPGHTDASVPGPGAYLYTVHALDGAGNASPASAPAPFVVGAPAPAGRLAAFPGTNDGVHLASSMQVFGGARIPDLATALRLARAVDLLTVVPAQLGGFADEMHAANPDLRIFLYQNGMFAQSGQGDLFPASWYMASASGARVRSRGYGNYLMDPRSTEPHVARGVTYAGWQDWVVKRAGQLLAAAPGTYDGLFIDMLGTAPLEAGYNVDREVPLNTATGREFTTEEYLALTGDVGATVSTRLGVPVIGNGLASGRRFYAAPTQSLLERVPVGDAEVWLRTPGSPATAYPTTAVWQQNVQMLIDAAAMDAGVHATVKTWSGGTIEAREAWRLFALASFLIGNSGHSWFEFTSGQRAMPWDDLSPLYELAIGQPVESHATVAGFLRDGVYQRDFTAGKVVVNPSPKAVSVTLDGTYVMPDGSAVTALALAPNSAAILTR